MVFLGVAHTMNVGIYLGYIEEGMGGEYTFQESIIKALEKIDTSHHFFIFDLAGVHHAQSGKKVTFVSVQNTSGLPEPFIKRLFRLLGKKEDVPDPLQLAVENHRIDIMWYPSPQFALLGIPYICTVLDLEHRKHPFFPEVGNDVSWDAAIRRYTEMIPRAAYVITGTEEGKKQIVDFYHADENRVRVIPFPVPPFAFEEKAKSAGILEKFSLHSPYLFYPAQFWPHKNHIALVHTLKLLRDRHTLDIEVVFCGSDKGNLLHVLEMAQELGLENHVRFLGFVTKEELYDLYRNAFAMVYPSLFGPDNLPPLEAFAIGCPVVASRVAGSVEQLGDAALLVDPRHEEEIAAAVVRLYEPKLKADLIAKGKERAQQLTASNYVREILTICDEFELYRRCWTRKRKHVNL